MRALERLGFAEVNQEGSHLKMRKRTADGVLTVIVPMHRERRKGTLEGIAEQAHLTVDDIMAQL